MTCPHCQYVMDALDTQCPRCGKAAATKSAPAQRPPAAGPLAPPPQAFAQTTAPSTASSSAPASSAAPTRVPAPNPHPPGSFAAKVFDAGQMVEPRIRYTLGGVVMIVLGVVLVQTIVSMAHKSGKFFPYFLVLGPGLVGVGLEMIIIGLTCKGQEPTEFLGLRMKVLGGLGVAVGFGLYFMLKQGML